MDGAELTTPAPMGTEQQQHVSRPTLGFPLGTALLLIIIFSLSGLFSCCYHWDKLRSLRRRTAAASQNNSLSATDSVAAAASHPQLDQLDDQHSVDPSPPSKLATFKQRQQDREQSLPVVMPGDQIPKFMAWPCPRQPSSPTTARNMKFTVEVVFVPSIASHCAHP